MAATAPTDPVPSSRWGLGTKLFAILALLGTVAVAVTAILSYTSSRAALEDAIFRQLTSARHTKARQVEAYFRTVRNELRLLASTRMVVDAAKGFRTAFEELEHKGVNDDLREKVEQWYAAHYLPDVSRLTGTAAVAADYLPDGPAAIYLQYHYIVANPNPPARRDLLDDAGDGSAYSALHAVFHPLLRSAATTVGFFDFMLVDAHSGRNTYGMTKEPDFATSLRTGPYRQSHFAAAAAQCSAQADPSASCLEDFSPYLPADGEPSAFMAAPVIDQGKVIAVLVAQLSITEIDRVVTGDRRWQHDGFGATGETYLVGPDSRVRSGERLFYENRDSYFAELRETGHPPEEIEAIRRHGSPVLVRRIDTQATRAALAGIEGTGEVIGPRGELTLASWGPLAIPGVKWALVAEIDASEAFAPVYRLERTLAVIGGIVLLMVIGVGAWLSRHLLGPLRDLTSGVRRFAGGDRAAHVRVRTQDEVGQLCVAFNGMIDDINAKDAVIEAKSRQVEDLLLNVLPAPIANRLREGEQSIADGFADVSVLFADIVGFTQLSSEMPPQNVVALLNGLFTRFDQAAHELGIEKIKTVGDAYMAVCGLPDPVPDHAVRVLRMAIRMVHIAREHALENKVDMKLRVGINSGPVVAGVIGKSKYIYDLWGDTVNLASRMESGGVPGAIQVTRSVYEQLKDQFAFEARGPVEVKGKGSVEAWLLRL
ncbi:MAG: HAMP domain-containing protein [Enhydrobacter sp.]|nr:MAG: HAMP domain-containing protein [Enhydrobacter sp.]